MSADVQPDIEPADSPNSAYDQSGTGESTLHALGVRGPRAEWHESDSGAAHLTNSAPKSNGRQKDTRWVVELMADLADAAQMPDNLFRWSVTSDDRWNDALVAFEAHLRSLAEAVAIGSRESAASRADALREAVYAIDVLYKEKGAEKDYVNLSHQEGYLDALDAAEAILLSQVARSLDPEGAENV